MASTANNTSTRLEAAQVITSFLIDENNNGMDDADDLTPGSGFFMMPSTVAARDADTTGYIVTAATTDGKLEFTDPNTFGASILLSNLGDVTFATAAVVNNTLRHNGTVWVNSAIMTVDDLTTSGVNTFGDATTDLVGFYGATPIAQPTISTVATPFDAGSSNLTNGTATHGGWTGSGLVTTLITLGLLA